MEQMMLNALAMVAFCWSVHQLRTGIAEPLGAPFSWTKRAVAHRNVPNRRVRP